MGRVKVPGSDTVTRFNDFFLAVEVFFKEIDNWWNTIGRSFGSNYSVIAYQVGFLIQLAFVDKYKTRN